MQKSLNNKLSELGRESSKVGCKTCYADNKIGVQLGIFVSACKSISVKYVDVDKRAALFKMRDDEPLDYINSVLVCSYTWVKFDLQGSSIAVTALNGRNAARLSCGSAVNSESGVGICTVGDRLTRTSAIWSCANL